jgi:hypothetical protein
MKPDQLLDIKIQEAAAQYESVYKEQAWDVMEKLLDEKMPQKKDKRKIIWLLILFLLLLGTGSLLLTDYAGQNKEKAIVEKDQPPALGNTLSDASNITIKETKKEPALSRKTIRQSAYTTSLYNKSVQNTKGREKIINDVAGNKNAIIYKSDNNIENNNKANTRITNLEKNNPTEKTYNSQGSDHIEKDTSVTGTNNKTGGNDDNNLLTKNDNKDISHKKMSTPKRKGKFINSFALSISLGPDVSAVQLNNAGKINLAYGAGVSYQLSKRLTLRTGFYVEQKVYDASTSDYHPPARFWNYYPNLKYIDADCKVYEVPLIINYNFSQAPKYNWFGSAGISSFFMKKEDYNFFSKNPSGQTSYNSYTINNENQHYLSSIRLSAGYERKVKNNISIIAEPYLSLPLTGVGYGKVKLYSTGILLTVNVKPFAQKK